MGLGVFQRLDVVVDLHRHHPRLPRDVAADHQHHAELADGVGEAEDGGGQEARARQRHDHAEEGVERRGAQGGRHFQRALARWPRRRSGWAAPRRAGSRTPRRPPGRQKVKGKQPEPKRTGSAGPPVRGAPWPPAGRSRAPSAAARWAAPPPPRPGPSSGSGCAPATRRWACRAPAAGAWSRWPGRRVSQMARQVGGAQHDEASDVVTEGLDDGPGLVSLQVVEPGLGRRIVLTRDQERRRPGGSAGAARPARPRPIPHRSCRLHDLGQGDEAQLGVAAQTNW